MNKIVIFLQVYLFALIGTAVAQESPCEPGFNTYNNDLMGCEIAATSILISEKRSYAPPLAFDGKPETAWVEGKKGDGIGEKIAFLYKGKCENISIMPGLGNPKYFKANNRIKKAKLCIYPVTIIAPSECFDKNYDAGELAETKDLTFKDEMKMQDFTLKLKPNMIKELGGEKMFDGGYIITIEIISVYPGAKWRDTCISEIKIY